MATIHTSVHIGHRWWTGPLRLLVVVALGFAAIAGAIGVSDAMSVPRNDLLACDRFAAVMAAQNSDLDAAYGNLDDAVADARGTAVAAPLAATVAAAEATRAGTGDIAEVAATTERFTAACRENGWNG